MLIANHLNKLFIDACDKCGYKNADPSLEHPKDDNNGDFASTMALRMAGVLHKNPREIANAIVNNFPDNDYVDKLEIAGPGFINVYLTNKAFADVIEYVRDTGQEYGKNYMLHSDNVCLNNVKVSPNPAHSKINLEYISANPTGPMHVGHGRWAALGDSIARILRHVGYDVFEEFYVNDHGHQMDLFAKSVYVRYRQLLGDDIDMPDDSYGGDYVIDIAKNLLEKYGPDLDDMNIIKKFGFNVMLNQIKETLLDFGNHFDKFFYESCLYDLNNLGKNEVESVLEMFKTAGIVYDKDGATWFKSSNFGDEKDRVIIKENGDMTYFLSDCAYHYNKFDRGFNHLIDIWGADHHGYIPRMKAMIKANGNNPDSLEVILGQLVNLYRDGKPVRMSKRSGEMVTFGELIEEVGSDATRFLMLSASADQPIDFDIELAKKQDSTNPVYYVQYAHARICSILRRAYLNFGNHFAGVQQAGEAFVETVPVEEISQKLSSDYDLSLLADSTEVLLCKLIDSFPEVVLSAAVGRAPHKIVYFSRELAQAYHQFYTKCHILNAPSKLANARLILSDAVRITLALSLDLLGVNAPVRM